MTTLLAALVDASNRAAETSSRLAKRDAIAECLRGAAADEVEIAVAYLSGEIQQGRIGVGWATLSKLRGAPAAETRLALREVDDALGDVAATAGEGSAAARNERLRTLFERAAAAEQDFLLRLLVGELRRGALDFYAGALARGSRLDRHQADPEHPAEGRLPGRHDGHGRATARGEQCSLPALPGARRGAEGLRPPGLPAERADGRSAG